MEVPFGPKEKMDHSPPTLEPYLAKLERFELFSTNQCYYLIGCNKLNTTYRVLKMDRTLIERPATTSTDYMTPHNSNNNNRGGIPYNSARISRSNESSSISLMPPNLGQAGGIGQSFDRIHSGGYMGINHTESAPAIAAATVDSNSHTAKPTLRPLQDFLIEDPNSYTQEEIKDMLDMIHDGNRTTKVDGAPGQITGNYNTINSSKSSTNLVENRSGGLKPIVKAYGVVGFIRFLDCYYLTLIIRRAKVGTLGGNAIYTIKNTETIPLKPAERGPVPGSDLDNADPSSVLLSMWNRGKRSVGLGLTNREIAELRYQGLYQVVDLTKNFYFSYTYDLTRSLQENFLTTTANPFPPPPFKDMYAWNYFLTRDFETCLSYMTAYHWIMPLVHGAFVQRKVNDYGRCLNLVLLARRSRHFAGTRYLKRGVSEQGKVANDVEHEQIVHDESMSSPGTFASYLQVRGSIPTFWTQESSVTMPKPPIELNRVDPTYTATQLHFADLFKRYSSPIVICDLVKQSERREREVRVGNEFRHAVDYINNTIDDYHKIRYCALDYSHISKHRNLDVSSALNEVATWAVNQTGFFCSDPKWKLNSNGTISPFSTDDHRRATSLATDLGIPIFPMEQHGVFRTNCIDCLDRTNVAQFSAGVEAIGHQLVCMGIRSKAKLGPSSSIVRVLIDMYVDIGDAISLQYGGSEAHKKVQQASSESNITGPIGKHKELLTSIRRYYSNAFTDRLKQDAMNLFLGYYLPYRHIVPLWEMENDYYLHNFHVTSGRGVTASMRSYQREFGIAWNDDDEEVSRGYPSIEHDFAQQNQVASTPRPSSPRRNRDKLSRHPSVARDRPVCKESARVLRVRNRCSAQQVALSSWWKTALQYHFHQRMWMRFSTSQVEAELPPRFERIYQPEKLSQFDRFFSRTWSTPVRSSHAAQHAEGADDGEGTDYPRVISLNFATSCASFNNDEGLAVSEFIKKWGFGSRSEPNLKLFAEHHRKSSVCQDYNYVGATVSSTKDAKLEYLDYVAPPSKAYGPPNAYRAAVIDEFKACLDDYTLESDDVTGIQKLAKSAHLSETILHGPYQGLSKDESAIQVATVIQEKLDAFRVPDSNKQRITENDLSVKGLGSVGVCESIDTRLRELERAWRLYGEVVEGRISACQRSDLTDDASFMLYASVFDSATKLMAADQVYLQVNDPMAAKASHWPISKMSSATPVPFVKKAARLGIHIEPCTVKSRDSNPPLYRSDQRKEIPAGFEQINDDLFARTDNKFMVFNGAGVDSYDCSQTVTKISNAERILLSTFMETP